MPIKKTTPQGPKAKLMAQSIPALRKKAKALGVSDYTKRTKDNLVQSIMLAEARKKRGTGMAGRTAKLKPVPQKKVGRYEYSEKYGRTVRPQTSMPTATLNTEEHEARRQAIRKFENSHTPTKQDEARFAMRPGKRISKNGNVYYEYRGNRADGSVDMHGDEPTRSTQSLIDQIESALDMPLVYIAYYETIHGKIVEFQTVESFTVAEFQLNLPYRWGKDELANLLKVPGFRWCEAYRSVESKRKQREFDYEMVVTKITFVVGF